MKVLIGIAHPAHVHFYKNFLWETEDKNIITKFTVREPGLATKLLDTYDINYEIMLSEAESDDMIVPKQLKYEWRTLQKVKEYKPDVITGIGGITAAHISAVTNTKSIIFTDTEHATVNNKLGFPFADQICTPDCYIDNIGENQVRYPGYHELAYLHPNRFKPDPSILDDLGLVRDDKFVILRTVDWNAVHDFGDSGFEDLTNVVQSLEETGAQVFITAEGDIPKSVEHCQLTIEPHRIHHLMYYADLFIGESATMATESAILGTPAVFISSSRRGYTDELEKRYGLVFNFSEEDRQRRGLPKAIAILEDYDTGTFTKRRKRMLEDKVDTTNFIVNQIIS